MASEFKQPRDYARSATTPSNGRVFVALPHRPEHQTQWVWKQILAVCEKLELSAFRVDDDSTAGDIFQQVLKGIREAEFVIADLSGWNPNVVYEVSFGHAVKPETHVLLLKKKDSESKFNFHNFRKIEYEDCTDCAADYLRRELERALRKLVENRPGFIIRGLDERTDYLANRLEEFATRVRNEDALAMLRHSGSMSSFAISDDPPEGGEPKSNAKAIAACHPRLLDERDTLIALADQGCRVRCLISPPHSNVEWATSSIVVPRLETLLAFMKGRNKELTQHVEFAASTSIHGNVFILGDEVAIESYLGRAAPGHGFTMRIEERRLVDARSEIFDLIFDYALEQNPDPIAAVESALSTWLRRPDDSSSEDPSPP